MTVLNLTPIQLTPGASTPEDITAALAASPLGSNASVTFVNDGRTTLIIQTNATSGGTTVTTDIGTTIQGQAVPGIQVTEVASKIEQFGPFSAQYNKQDGSNLVQVDFGTPANVSGVIAVRQPGIA